MTDPSSGITNRPKSLISVWIERHARLSTEHLRKMVVDVFRWEVSP